jgi:hypothetical protein
VCRPLTLTVEKGFSGRARDGDVFTVAERGGSLAVSRGRASP